MKTIKLVIILSAIFLLESCNSATNNPETTTQQENETMKNELITGKVQEVQQGKDGYTAKIITADSLVYFATISHANLRDNAAQYRSVTIGETITVAGDIWKMEEETHITVRELK